MVLIDTGDVTGDKVDDLLVRTAAGEYQYWSGSEWTELEHLVSRTVQRTVTRLVNGVPTQVVEQVVEQVLEPLIPADATVFGIADLVL